MPNMDGYTTTKIIQEDQNLSKIPVIAISASVLGEDRKKAEKFGGFSHFLTKPTKLEDILLVLQNFIPSTINRKKVKS